MDPLSDHPTEAHEAAGNAIERPDDPTPPAAPGSDRILHQPAGIRPPLSYSQQRLWFMDQLEPGSIDYNRTFALRLSGPLDLDSLRHSLNEIVRRHEVLRTSFPAIEGRPFQQVNPPHPLDIPLLDLSGLPGPDRRSEAARLARQVASRPFDLIHDLLIRPGLIRLDQEQHVLHLTTHHIAFDGFSESIFLRELAALYTAARAGADPQLAEPVIQYGDYAAWERQRAQGGALNEDLAYWRKALSDLSPRPGLPTLEGESPAVDGAVGQERLELPGPLSEAVRGVCRREGVTPFMMFASVFVLLLHRL
ncbi:MAG TPA: condensation domain-containing protein, partial [Anaerolineales bacterium]|nr:condensation domain-containing protein [Anaerolineales bacterium]